MEKNLIRGTLSVKVQESSTRISSALIESSKFRGGKNKRVTTII